LWTFQASFVFFAIIVLAVWDVPDILKFVAFYFGGFSGMASCNDSLRQRTTLDVVAAAGSVRLS
jgi:hypothetical protein